MPESVFDLLKKQNAPLRKHSAPEPVFFRINSGKEGVSLQVVNSRMREFSPDPYLYSLRERQLLQLVEQLREKMKRSISWDNAEQLLVLGDHDYLIPLFSGLENVIDGEGNRISMSSEQGTMLLTLQESSNGYNFRLEFHAGEERSETFTLLSRQYVLMNSTIYPCKDLGPDYNQLILFNANIRKNQLEIFLSLFFSRYQNMKVDLQGYSLHRGEQKTPVPTIIIRHIDDNLNLELSVEAVLPGFKNEYLNEYDFQMIASLDALEKKIIIHELRNINLETETKRLEDILKSIRSGRAGKTGKKAVQQAEYYVSDRLFIIEEPIARVLIYEHFGELMSRFQILGEGKLKAFHVRPVMPRLDLSLGKGIGYLEGSLQLEVDGGLYSLADFLKELTRKSYIILNDGSHGIVDRSYLNKLKRVFHPGKEGVKVSFFDLPLVEELIGEKVAARSFSWARDIFKGFNTLSTHPPKLPKIEGTLRSYQEYGFSWLNYLYKHKLGGCLADDMGLGKTIQAITLLTSVYSKGNNPAPTLLIVPTTLMYNWKQEIEKFSPGLSFYLYHGQKRDFGDAKTHSVIITSYGTMRNDIKILKEMKFHLVILDESQKIKNIKSQISRAVMLLSADFRLALSGTPIENNLLELYSLFRFLNPFMFGSEKDFIERYVKPIQENNDKEVMRELQKKIYPFILRRTKEVVLEDLPDKVEQIIHADMSTELARYYEDRRKMYFNAVRLKLKGDGLNKSRLFILQAMSELRQIASIPERPSEGQFESPKIDLLMESLEEIASSGHKALVFVNYLDTIDLVGRRLDESGIEYVSMSGKTRNRGALVHKFQEDSRCRVFIMTLKTGGVGLNLTAADYVFIFDPWWNIAAENQAIDRAHRIGQKNTVFSYKLITRGTIEEKILILQERKKKLFDDLLSGGADSIKKLSEDDIDFIFEG